MPITFAQAALGAEIAVPTLYGKVKLKLRREHSPVKNSV